MLTLTTTDARRDCSGMTRRDLIRVGSSAIGGPALLGLLGAGPGVASSLKDKAVVVLFLAGGPSHIETFDPRMDAPEGVRSTVGEIPSALPGVTFGSTFPGLAARARKLTIVRSFHHTITDHAKAIKHVLTAGSPLGAGMGAVYSRIRGATDPKTAMPTHGIVTTEEIDGQYVKEKARVQDGCGPGALARSNAPFDPSGSGGTLDLMRLTLPRERFDDRRALLDALDQAKRSLDRHASVESMTLHERSALDLILRNAGEALDLGREDQRVVESYDTSAHSVGHKRFRPCTLGRQLLMARRLVEVGCGFVTVQNSGWDMHADGNNPGIEQGMKMLGPAMDKAVSAFLDDLESRGLSEKVLLVITGDFGRTPRVNKRGGRDHWAALSTLAFAGGGLPMGRVIGRSSRFLDVPAADPVSPADLMATLMNYLFDLPTLRLQPEVPRDIAAMLEAARPIRDML